MSRSWQLFLRDMIESATKITRFTGDCGLEMFVSNDMVYDAVLYNLQILGEAAKKIRIRSVNGIPRSTGEASPDSVTC